MADSWWNKLVQKLKSLSRIRGAQEKSQRKPVEVANVQMVFDLTREPKPNLGLPPEAIPGLSVIKELVRELRYRRVEQLVGLKVKLTSIDNSLNEVRLLVSNCGVVLGDSTSDSSGAGTFLKYGLLDYEFDVVSADLVAERQKVRFLKDMGILPDKEDVDDSFLPDGGVGYLEEMVDVIKKGKLVFKVILDSRGTYQGAKGTPSEKWTKLDPDKFFPCEFVVRDACITNCSMIWLLKHFYL